MIVTISHAGLVGLTPNFSFYETGQIGVMIFFVLSGYLMFVKYCPQQPERESILDFMFSRITRIIPLYMVVGLVSFLVYNFLDSQFAYAMPVKTLIRHLLLLSESSVFWTIAAETQFYMLFPLIWILSSRDRSGGYGLVAALLFICLILQFFDFPGRRMFVVSSFHAFAFGICAGVLAMHVPSFGSGWKAGALPLAVLIALLVGAFWFEDLLRGLGVKVMDIWDIGWLPAPIAYVVFVASLSGGLLLRFLSFHPFLWLGKISYSLYLVHSPILVYASQVTEHYDLLRMLGLLVAITGSLVLAMISFRLIETPARQYLNTRLRTPRRAIIAT